MNDDSFDDKWYIWIRTRHSFSHGDSLSLCVDSWSRKLTTYICWFMVCAIIDYYWSGVATNSLWNDNTNNTTCNANNTIDKDNNTVDNDINTVDNDNNTTDKDNNTIDDDSKKILDKTLNLCLLEQLIFLLWSSLLSVKMIPYYFVYHL